MEFNLVLNSGRQVLTPDIQKVVTKIPAGDFKRVHHFLHKKKLKSLFIDSGLRREKSRYYIPINKEPSKSGRKRSFKTIFCDLIHYRQLINTSHMYSTSTYIIFCHKLPFQDFKRVFLETTFFLRLSKISRF